MRRAAGTTLLWVGCLSANLSGGQTLPTPSIAPPPAWVDIIRTFSEPKPVTNELSEGVVFILLDNQVNVVRDEHYHRVIKDLISESGVQHGAQLNLHFDPSYQELIIHRITVQRGSNTLDRLQPEKIKVIQQERDLERHTYDGTLSAILFLEDVRVGDRIDFSYTVRGSNPILEGRYVDSFFAKWGSPVQRNRFRLVWPANRHLGIKNHGLEVQVTTTKTNGLNEHIWDLHDLPAVAEEDSVPSSFNAYPWVQLSEFASWEDVAEWAARLYPRIVQLPPEMTEKIERWQRSLKQPAQRLAAALQFVQEEVRYLGFELGPQSHKPSDPSIVFARRFGDCKDKAYLLCTILQRMDIDASPALVHTDYQKTIENWVPSPYAFDHVVVRVQLDGKIYWIDPTRSHERGPIEQRYFPDYGRCLLVRPGTSALTVIPLSQAGWPKTTIHETFGVHGRKEPAQFTVHTLAEGLAANRLRAYFAETSREEVEKNYLNYYAREYPKLKAGRPLEVRDQSEQNQLETTEHYEIPEFWTFVPDEAHYRCEFYPQTFSKLFERPGTTLRSMPLEVDHPRHEILRTEVNLPEPWPVEKTNRLFHNAAAEMRLSRTIQKNKLLMEYEYRSITNCIAPRDIPAYIESLGQVENHLGYSLTWAKEGVSTATHQINWSVLSLAGVYSVLLIIGATVLYRFRRSSSLPVSEPPPETLGRNLSGLGGWLLLVGLGVILSPIRIARGIAQLSSAYSLETWDAVTTPSGGSYHALWAPLLIFELLGNLTLLALSALLVVLFFQRRRTFPLLYIIFLGAAAVIFTIDHFAAEMIPYVAAQAQSETSLRPLIQSWFVCLIWIPYMLVSNRVKSTFLR